MPFPPLSQVFAREKAIEDARLAKDAAVAEEARTAIRAVEWAGDRATVTAPPPRPQVSETLVSVFSHYVDC